MFEERRRQVEARCKELISLAETKFGIIMPPVEIRFDLRGRSAGQAGRKRTLKGDHYFMRFNTDMMVGSGWEHLYKDTIPHELAHVICFYRENDRAHGKWWRWTCRQLGGSGERCHSEEIEYAKGKTWYYVTKSGAVVTLSSIRHRKVQSGVSYLFKQFGRVDRTCWHSTERPETPRVIR
jgi:predicted SprT family Zn-dependent metalloprotease